MTARTQSTLVITKRGRFVWNWGDQTLTFFFKGVKKPYKVWKVEGSARSLETKVMRQIGHILLYSNGEF